MSSSLYEEFFLHYFVNPQHHKFTYLQEKFNSYQNPGLDHPKKSFDLGYLKNYRIICSKYLCYVPSEKTEIRFTLDMIMEIIYKIYEEYAIFFEKGGAYRMIFNSKSVEDNQIRKLKAHIQEMTLTKLCEKFPEQKLNFKSLDRYVMGFFFTLNYIKTCNLDVKGFCMLLYAQNDDSSLNIQNVFGNFMIQRLSEKHQIQGQYQEQEAVNDKNMQITVRNFQKILKILSKDDELTNLSILTQQQNNSMASHHGINDYSTIKSIQLKQQQDPMLGQEKLRSIVAFQIFINFLKENQVKLTQIKIFKLLKLVGLVKDTQSESLQQEVKKKNGFSNLKSWEQVLNFCFQKNSLKSINEISSPYNPQQLYAQLHRLPYEKIFLMEICKLNFIISQRLVKQNPQVEFQTLQAYREETYDFILNYLTELFDGKNEQNKENYEILQKLKKIYEFGDVVLKPLVKRVLKHQEIHKIYLKYFGNLKV